MASAHFYKQPEPGKYIITGFQTVGFISVLALSYLEDKGIIKDSGYIESENGGYVALVEKGDVTFPIRVLESDDAIFISSELPMLRNEVDPVVDEIINIYKKNKCKAIIALDGIGINEQKNTSEVYYVPVNLKDKLTKFKLLEEGAVFGLNARLAFKCKETSTPLIMLMAETHESIPDGIAAAALISALKTIIKLDVDTSGLVMEYKKMMGKINRTVKNVQPAGEEKGQEELYG